jgi:hypothetical protein
LGCFCAELARPRKFNLLKSILAAQQEVERELF